MKTTWVFGLRIGPVLLALSAVALGIVGLVGMDQVAWFDRSSSARPASSGLSLKGTVSDLYPGNTVRMQISVTNREQFPVRITRLDVQVRADRRRPGCSPRQNVRVSSLRRPFIVRARGRARTSLRITMLRKASDACRSARFPLVFRATGERP